MPDDRLFHRRACHGDRSTSLNDLEYRVWTTFLLNADDYGVMRFSVSALRAANDALETRPAALLERAFERVLSVGLVRVFEHQGKRYAYQHDWQDWQSVRHPRQSVNPIPPPDQIDECSPLQRELFARKIGNRSEELPKNSRNGSEAFLPLAGAGTREEAKATGQRLMANGQRLEAFERFWAVYPNKKAKEAARRAWLKLTLDDVLVDRILAAVQDQRRSTAWMKDGGQFIPHPATWLNQGRWQDEALEIPQIGDKTARNMEAIFGK
jgi:hypothetical protein